MTEYKEIILKELDLITIEPWKRLGGGACNSDNWAFKTNIGEIFAKISQDDEAEVLLSGEFESLKALDEAKCVNVPKPIKFIHSNNTSMLVTEFVNFDGLRKFQGELGERFAKLHMRNIDLIKQGSTDAVDKFGFPTTVCCGRIPLNNTWNDDWIDFYTNQRLKPQVEMIAKNGRNKEIESLWKALEPRIKELFLGITVKPSLLHGDLWSGNAGETNNFPIIFDPASFYGHHEFDLAITRMFGGFTQEFYTRYHQVIPREPGFEERKLLYDLFHYLNHWNHFGGGYADQSLNIMRKLTKLK